MINISLTERSAKPGLKLAEIEARKTYGQTQMSEVVDLRSFSQHIASHGCVYGRSDIMAVLIKMVDCMYEMLLEGKKVQLGDLGSFSPTISTEGADTAAEFTTRNIKKVGVLWSPGEMFKDLSANAEFQLVPSRKGQARLLKQERGLDVAEEGGNAGGNAVQPGDDNNGGGQQPGGNGGGNAGGNDDNDDGME